MAGEDPRETRKIARNWREYLGESTEGFGVYLWAWREFITPESRRHMKMAVGALLVASVLGFTQPWLIKTVIDGCVGGDRHGVTVALGILGGIMLVERLLFWMFDHNREHSLGVDLGRVDNRATELFFDKSLGQHLRDDGLLTAANVEKGRNRVLEVEHMLIFDGVTVLSQVLISFVFLLSVSLVAGAAMFGLLCVYLGFLVYVNTKVLQVCTPIDAELRRFNRHRVERWDNIERVKTNGKAGDEVAHMTKWFAAVIREDRRFWQWVIRIGTVRGVINLLVVWALMGYGAWLVLRGDWTVGLLYPFYKWMSAFAENLWRIGHIEHRLNWNMPAVRAMKLALTQPSQVVDAPGAIDLPSDVTPRVELRSLDHSYGGALEEAGSMHVLSDVSFTVEPGEKVALLGPSGAGKTTVMRLLQRYMDPERGAILVGGTDLRDVKLASWTRLIGYIPQQTQVLDGTLRYNLLYGLPDRIAETVTDDELWKVMRTLRIDFGERLTDGLDTVVGRRGVKLSGGQAQRLMIGAAVLSRPRVLVIDEATSSLDSTTEKAVQEGLRKLLRPETSVLVIAHRLSTVEHLCDTFVVLVPAERAGARGQVEAIASSFPELAIRSPTFRRLAADQGLDVAASASHGESRARKLRVQ